jgi:nicotinate-nucleotide pyrophosphorylase (carboxylating)
MATTTLTSLPALPADLDACVERALAEDVGAGDLTARLVDENAQARADVIAREAAVLCGQPWFQRTFERLDPRVQVT